MNPLELRERLVRRRSEILGAVRGPSEVEQDLELDNLDVLFRIDLADRRELCQINNTLERIENGTYGCCEYCGGAIAERRLRVSLHAEICDDCVQAAADTAGRPR